MTPAHDHEGCPQLRYVERFATILVAAGFPAMPARVFVAFLISDSDRLTAADLGGMLQVSPAAVSGAVRYLTGVGLVHKERVPGSRRDYYRMPPNVWSEVMRLQSQVLVRWAGLLKEGMDLVGDSTPAGARLTEHTAFFDFLTIEIPGILDRWDAISASRLCVLLEPMHSACSFVVGRDQRAALMCAAGSSAQAAHTPTGYSAGGRSPSRKHL